MYSDQSYTPLAVAEYLGDPQTGDFDMGAGLSTSQLQNPNVALPAPASLPQATGWFQSPAVLGLVVILLILVKILSEKAGSADEFRTVRVGFENWFIVGALAATWIFVWKTIALTWRNPAVLQFFGFI